jgi:coatomer protein complex subunit epsilon
MGWSARGKTGAAIWRLSSPKSDTKQGGEKYQSAFYTYEELATAPPADSTATNTRTLLGQAIAEIHLGRLPEAEAALETALSQTGSIDDQDVIANAIVLHTLLGRTEEVVKLKEQLGEEHALKQDLAAKREAFEAAMAKYQPKFEIAA